MENKQVAPKPVEKSHLTPKKKETEKIQSIKQKIVQTGKPSGRINAVKEDEAGEFTDPLLAPPNPPPVPPSLVSKQD